MIKINPLTEGMSSALEICSFKRDYYRLLYFFPGPLISPLSLGRQDLSRRMRTEQQMCSLTAAFCSGHLQPRVPIPVGDRQERGDRGHSGAGWGAGGSQPMFSERFPAFHSHVPITLFPLPGAAPFGARRDEPLVSVFGLSLAIARGCDFTFV